jgi:hypothetical protein
MALRSVGTLLVDVADRSTEDRSHYHAELAEGSYRKLGLRPFSGAGHVGGFDHIYGDGDTATEAVTDLASVLSSLGLTGSIKVRS